jgi:Malectin domain
MLLSFLFFDKMNATSRSLTKNPSFMLECIGPLYLEQSGLRNWSDDTFFSGGSTYSISNVPVDNTDDDPIYQSERLGAFSYSIPVPVGTYDIIIHLAELYVAYSI